MDAISGFKVLNHCDDFCQDDRVLHHIVASNWPCNI